MQSKLIPRLTAAAVGRPAVAARGVAMGLVLALFIAACATSVPPAPRRIPAPAVGEVSLIHSSIEPAQHQLLDIGVVIFDNLPKLKKKKSRARPHLELPQFHAVERDFAFVVDSDVTAAQVINAAEKADKKLIAQVSLFDVFEGGDLGEGKKSLAVNVVLQPVEKTLTDAEIDAIAEKVVANVTKATGGVLRG